MNQESQNNRIIIPDCDSEADSDLESEKAPSETDEEYENEALIDPDAEDADEDVADDRADEHEEEFHVADDTKRSEEADEDGLSDWGDLDLDAGFEKAPKKSIAKTKASLPKTILSTKSSIFPGRDKKARPDYSHIPQLCRDVE